MQLRLTESGWGGTTRLTVLSAQAFFIVSSLRRKLRCVSGIASELSARRFGDSRLTNLSHGLSADGIAPRLILAQGGGMDVVEGARRLQSSGISPEAGF